ncbi:MAG TPA: ABC-2 family transporter protein [Polyangiaceae bacterium]|jgi:ABC-2 type transport system permease protein
MRSLRFYWTLYKVALRSRTEYRADFLIGVVTAVAMQLAGLAFYWVVFSKTPALGGWSAPRVLFLFGLSAMVLALSELTLNGIWQLPMYILNGELDRLFVYPVRSLVFLLVSRPELHSLGNLTSGALIVAYAWHLAPVPSSALVLLPLWIVCGTLVYTAVLVLLGCLSFSLVGPWSTHLFAAYQLLNATRYPLGIYPKSLKIVLLYLFPLGAAIFVPGAWLESGKHFGAAVLAPLAAAALMVTLAFTAWESALRRYQSTGS